MKRAGIIGLAVALALTSCARSASAPPLPRWGLALEGNPLTPAAIAAANTEAGVPAQLVSFFVQWPERPVAGGFPRATLDAIDAARATPILTWEPMYYRAADGAETMIPAAAILRGDYDAYIDAFAREASAWGRPILLRFAHEMNLSRYHWGGTPAEFGPETPQRFQSMWRHIVDRFRRAGATNVKWAFSPNCESVPQESAAPWNRAAAYYPGNEYVDVVGIDGYNWGDTQTPERNGWRSSWRPFAAIFAPMREELRRIAPGKPLYVFETASAPTGGDKAAWLQGMADTARAWGLEGVVWFQVRKEVDWRLQSGVAASAIEGLRSSFTGAQ